MADKIPYTEIMERMKSDIDYIVDEAFEDGRKSVEDDYKLGCEVAEEARQKAYQLGLTDAWECARKIYLDVNKGGLSANALTIIFGNSNMIQIFKEFSASEVIEKIKAYEQEKEEQKEPKKEQKEPKKEQSVTAEDVMRQYLDTFCKRQSCCDCPLNTSDFTCGRGYHFLTAEPVSDEEVRRAYAKVLQKMREG